MRQLRICVLFLFLMPGCAWATEGISKGLEFYKQEILTLPMPSTRDSRAYAVALAAGLDTWAQQHPHNEEALQMQTRLLLHAQEKGASIVTLFKWRYLFPQTAVQQLSPLWEEALPSLEKSARTQATDAFLHGPSASATTAPAKQAEMLYALSKLSGKDFYPAASQAFEHFFAHYPQYEGNNEVELWYGDLHRFNGNYLAAIGQYKKADALYPNSPYKAASLRLMGDIYADNLKNTAAATEAYTRVLRLFPNSAETGIVYKHMAILDENNKQYDSALINYNKTIDLLGATPAAYDAYLGKADVYAKTKRYDEAYTQLHHTAAVFATTPDKAAEALEKAARIARKKLHNNQKYIQSLEKKAALQPTSPATAQALYQIATTYEKQNASQQAVQTYQKLMLQFPTSSYATRAQKRLAVLTP